MEGAGSAVGGHHVLGAAQEPRGQRQQLQQREEEKVKETGAAAERRGGGGGGMKFRVHARAPHGVGALLLIGGAAVVGAAVLAWRGSRRGKKRAEEDPHDRRLAAKEEGLDSGVVEDGKVQGGSLVQKLDQSDENLSAGNTDVGSDRLDGNVSEESYQPERKEESYQVHKDNEITADQLDSKPEEKIVENSSSNPVEVDTHDVDSRPEEKIDDSSGSNPIEVDTHDLDSKPEEKIDESSSSNPVVVDTHDLDEEHVEEIEQKSRSNYIEITVQDKCQDIEHAEKIDHAEKIGDVEVIDQNSSRNPVEIIMQEMVTICLVSGNMEKVGEDSSKSDIEKEIAQKDNKDMGAPDQSRLSINGPGIILSKYNDESDGIQEAESMENTPTAQLMMHQDQLLDDMAMDTVTETEETTQDERTITEESELEQDETKALAGVVELVSSPALSSLVKPIEKKEPEFPRPSETGMKIEQDYTNGELREHDLVSKGGAMQGEGDFATMYRRSPALAILALIFVLTMGITIIVRLYAPARATKLQMDLP